MKNCVAKEQFFKTKQRPKTLMKISFLVTYKLMMF